MTGWRDGGRSSISWWSETKLGDVMWQSTWSWWGSDWFFSVSSVRTFGELLMKVTRSRGSSCWVGCCSMILASRTFSSVKEIFYNSRLKVIEELLTKNWRSFYRFDQGFDWQFLMMNWRLLDDPTLSRVLFWKSNQLMVSVSRLCAEHLTRGN